MMPHGLKQRGPGISTEQHVRGREEKETRKRYSQRANDVPGGGDLLETDDRPLRRCGEAQAAVGGREVQAEIEGMKKG